MPTALEIIRTSLQDLLPPVLDRTLASYQAFATLPPTLESKEFKEFHTAGRTALAHMDLLLRLVRWAEGEAGASADSGEEEGQNSASALSGMIAEAQAALQVLRASQGEESEG